jgi:hypothetical protein
VAEVPVVWAEAARRNPPPLRVVEEQVVLTGNAPPRQIHARREPIDELELLRSRVERIGQHAWSDLVCPEDNLHPLGGWMPDDGQADAGPSGEFNQ